MADPPVVALMGATALGKTEIAVALAERLGADIVVADSMQVYAGLPVLTNQPDERQRARARHHLVGFVSPHEEYTVAEYAAEAHRVIDELRAAGRPIVVEGGSGLYMRAALGDLEFAPAADAALRSTLQERWSCDPAGVLDELRRLDPGTWSRLDRANPRRVLRALEAVLVSGRMLPAAGGLWESAERYEHRLVCLALGEGREALARRIDERVDWMLAHGAVDEVATALDSGPLARTVCQAIGVEEVVAHLQGTATLADAAREMKRRTRALVRRQLTWMRRLSDTASVATMASPAETAEAILALLRERPW